MIHEVVTARVVAALRLTPDQADVAKLVLENLGVLRLVQHLNFQNAKALNALVTLATGDEWSAEAVEQYAQLRRRVDSAVQGERHFRMCSSRSVDLHSAPFQSNVLCLQLALLVRPPSPAGACTTRCARLTRTSGSPALAGL